MSFIKIKYLIFFLFLCTPFQILSHIFYLVTHMLSLSLFSSLVFFKSLTFVLRFFFPATTLCFVYFISLKAQMINFNHRNWSPTQNSSNTSLTRKPCDCTCLLTSTLLPNCVFASIWFGINQFVLHYIRIFPSNLISRSNW